MKYILVVGLEYKKYKKPASVTISVNDLFIDCFDLDKDYSQADDIGPMLYTKWLDELNKSHWVDPTNNRWDGFKLPKYIKIYHIDEEHLGGLLKIKVKNENSDFTNGFMKNSSLIKIPLIALFPSYMSDNKGEKLMKTLIRLNSREFTNSMQKEKHDWPVVDSFYIKRESEIYEKSKAIKNEHYFIGGNFTAELPVIKKHKVFLLKSYFQNDEGFFWPSFRSIAFAAYNSLLNIYNEDQRSNSTKD